MRWMIGALCVLGGLSTIGAAAIAIAPLNLWASVVWLFFGVFLCWAGLGFLKATGPVSHDDGP